MPAHSLPTDSMDHEPHLPSRAEHHLIIGDFTPDHLARLVRDASHQPCTFLSYKQFYHPKMPALPVNVTHIQLINPDQFGSKNSKVKDQDSLRIVVKVLVDILKMNYDPHNLQIKLIVADEFARDNLIKVYDEFIRYGERRPDEKKRPAKKDPEAIEKQEVYRYVLNKYFNKPQKGSPHLTFNLLRCCTDEWLAINPTVTRPGTIAADYLSMRNFTPFYPALLPLEDLPLTTLNEVGGNDLDPSMEWDVELYGQGGGIASVPTSISLSVLQGDDQMFDESDVEIGGGIPAEAVRGFMFKDADQLLQELDEEFFGQEDTMIIVEPPPKPQLPSIPAEAVKGFRFEDEDQLLQEWDEELDGGFFGQEDGMIIVEPPTPPVSPTPPYQNLSEKDKDRLATKLAGKKSDKHYP